MHLQPIQRSNYRRFRSSGLGDGSTAEAAQALPAIGSAVGGPIGSAIGQVIGTLTSLFGAKVHNTAGGETYKVAQSTFYSNQAQIETLYKQLAATTGIVPPTFPPTPANHDGAQNIKWVTQLIGMYLNDPTLATSSSAQLDKYKKNGTYDRALQAQAAVLQWLQEETSGSTGGLPIALVPTAPASSPPSTATNMIPGSAALAPGQVPSVSSVLPGAALPVLSSSDYSSLFVIGGLAIGAYLLFES
jgi:hypothetical protein